MNGLIKIKQHENNKINMTIELSLLVISVCILGLAYISTKEKWNNTTRPPKGWMQHNGFRTRINKL